MKIEINNIEYEVIEDNKEAIEKETLELALTDYFEKFDYVLGDWAYGKLRLKGFNTKTNANYKSINDFKNIHDYIKKNCAYGCRYFILKKIEKK